MVNLHRRGGLNPPECIHKYTLRSVIGQIQSAPTVDDSVIHNHISFDYFNLEISHFDYPLKGFTCHPYNGTKKLIINIIIL